MKKIIAPIFLLLLSVPGLSQAAGWSGWGTISEMEVWAASGAPNYLSNVVTFHVPGAFNGNCGNVSEFYIPLSQGNEWHDRMYDAVKLAYETGSQVKVHVTSDSCSGPFSAYPINIIKVK